MAEPVWALFDDFAARWARGERPDARGYLERAGDGAAELMELIDQHLQWAPVAAPDPDLVAGLASWRQGEPPLVELRRRRGRSRAAVVEALLTGLGIDPAKRSRVHDAYHRLETGGLPLSRVDPSVLATVGAALGARIADLIAWPGRAPVAESVLMRDAIVLEGAPAPWPETGEPDDVDRLFGLR